MRSPLFDPFDPAAVAHFDVNGWVLIADLEPTEARHLADWVDEVERMDGSATGVLHHYEMTDHGPRICRSENFVPVHVGMRHLLTERLAVTAGLLLGEPAVLYKEKINYKLSGGAGFAPHQDAPAYPFIGSHVSCMVAVDEATVENGCLEVVSENHHVLLDTDDRGCILADEVRRMRWRPAPLQPGQTLWFHSLTPHRSAANHSARDRRALYPTYNVLSAGDMRREYYEAKAARLAAAPEGGRVALSLIGDFEGRPVV